MPRRGAEDTGLRADLERLYALPPAAFTAARNELAGRLRREGRRDDAATIKALQRPTASSWAVSRLMRLEPGRFRALLAAGKQARQAQRQVVGGGARAPAGAPAARLREALRDARAAIEELRRRGLELLAADGRPPNAAAAERLGASLQALAYTAEAEAEIERGWLDHDLDAPGFEVLAGLQAAAGGAGKQPSKRPGPAAAASTTAGERRSGILGGRGAPPARAGGPAGPARAAGSAATSGPEARKAAPSRGPSQLPAREEERREREQERARVAGERERARLAEAEEAMRRAGEASARLAAAAAAAERDAETARRRAAEAERAAERARGEAESARRRLDRAGERLAAVRAAAAASLRASAAGAAGADETR